MTSSVFTAVLNGLIPSLLLTATVWLAMRLLPRRTLNAATRYLLWWTTLAATILLPALPALQPPVRQRRVAPMEMRLSGASPHAFNPGPPQTNPARVIPNAP